MTDAAIRRIAIACNATSDIRAAVDETAELARRCNAVLHGIFLEDENLYRLAELPFSRQLTLSPAVSEDWSAAEIEKLLPALGGSMRRMLADIAARHGVEWTFETVRGLPTMGTLAGIEADLLIIDAAVRPFAGSWHPRAFGDLFPEGQARTTLLRRQRGRGRGTAVICLGEAGDWERTLRLGLATAGPRDDVAILIRDGSAADRASAQRLADTLAAGSERHIAVSAMPAVDPLSCREIEHLQPRLLVLHCSDLVDPGIRDLLLSQRCNVLVVR